MMAPEDVAGAQQLLLLIGGGVALTNLLLALIWGGRHLVWNKPTFAPVWSLVDVWVGAQITFLLMLVLVSFWVGGVVLVRGLDALDTMQSFTGVSLRLFLFPMTFLQNACFFAVPALVIVLKYGKRLRDIGLPRLPRAQDVCAGILLGLILVGIVGVLEVGLHALAEQFRHVGWVQQALQIEQTNPVAQIMRILPQQDGWTLLLAVAAIGISAPLGEEMFFRGFLFNVLKQRWGVGAGVVVSGLLFAAVHTYALGLIPVFLLGMALAWVYHNSGSLWTSILIHATNNTLAVLFVYFFPPK